MKEKALVAFAALLDKVKDKPVQFGLALAALIIIIYLVG